MRMPSEIFARVKQKLWTLADEARLADALRSAKDRPLRGLGQGRSRGRSAAQGTCDPGNVRVYIKDTVMKPYGRDRIKYFEPVQRLLGLSSSAAVEEYVKPHGRRLRDGKVICWGLARDWKGILFALFERSHLVKAGVPYAAVLMYPNSKFLQPKQRLIVELAARKLEIERLIWYDG